MIRRRAVVGLSLLSALVFCAIAAQGALAEPATQTTAVTCVPEPLSKGDFFDAHCDNASLTKGGAFTHAPISENPTPFEATNKEVTNNTKESEPAVLKGTLLGGKLQISCTEVVGTGEISNTEPLPIIHKVSGTSTTNLNLCTVVEPKKCTVSLIKPIVISAIFEGVEGVKGTKGEANAMGLEFKATKKEEVLMEITLEGAECALKGVTFQVKGSMIATSGPTTESGQNNKFSGATTVFTPKFEMQKLQIGGKPAEFSTILTPRMVDNLKEHNTENPIALTTT